MAQIFAGFAFNFSSFFTFCCFTDLFFVVLTFVYFLKLVTGEWHAAQQLATALPDYIFGFSWLQQKLILLLKKSQ
jgi:hypothetical protein